jgi:hypothetical protein
MANAFSITLAVAEGMLNATGLATSLGASPTIVIYSGTAPTNVRTALSGDTVLATLTCASTPLTSFTDNGSTAAVATFGTITSATAAATGTASFFRIFAGATAIAQGSVGTSATDMILNTTAITSGSTVSLTSATISLPYGP